MPARKSTLIFTSVLLVAAAAMAGWWYVQGMQSQRLAQQSMALERGVAAFNQKNYAAVLDELRSVTPEHSEAWRARYYEGSAQIMLKDYAAAILLLEEALALNPTHTRTLHALGVAHFKLGNLALSKAYFAQVLEIDPTDEEARGLMDIMANLERMQPGHSPETQPDGG